MTRRRGWSFALVTTAILVGIVASAHRYADGDMGHLIAVEMRVAQLLREGEIGSALHLWWALITPQPPLGYVPGIAAYTLLGFHAWVGPAVMGLALLLAWDALWRVWGPRAWLAWLPLVASPLVWLAVEQHSRDLLAGAVLLQAWSWLAASSGFRERKAAAAFGFWLGVGFVVKYTFPIFAAFVAIAGGVPLLARGTKDRWKNLGFAVIVFLVPAGAWYAAKGAAVLGYVGFSAGAGMAGHTANFRDPMALESLVYYPLALRDAVSLPGTILLVAAAGFGLRGRESRAAVAGAWAGVLGGLAVLSSLPEAIDRYALPGFMLAIATLPALGGRLWGALPALAVFLPMAAYTATRFSPGARVVTATYDHPLRTARALAWPWPPAYRPSDLDPAAWRLAEVVAAIRAAQGRDHGTIGVLSGQGPTAGPGFATVLIAAAEAGFRWDYATVNTRVGPGAPEAFVGPLFDGQLPSAAFAVLVAFRAGQGDPAVDAWVREHPLTEVARIPGPAGGSSTVYRR